MNSTNYTYIDRAEDISQESKSHMHALVRQDFAERSPTKSWQRYNLGTLHKIIRRTGQENAVIILLKSSLVQRVGDTHEGQYPPPQELVSVTSSFSRRMFLCDI